jgi:hypothetical protein
MLRDENVIAVWRTSTTYLLAALVRLHVILIHGAMTAFCTDCPPCYKLVQEHITILREKVNELRLIIDNIGENPQAINDTDFRMKMSAVNASVVELWEDAMNAGGLNTTLNKET